MYPVSVLMSVYNGESYLQEAVESILNQSFRDFEFIIVDDGSTDRTKEILDTYKDPRIVRLVHKHNKGLIQALNYGLSIAQGRLIARQDADDISMPNRLEKQVQLFKANPSLILCGSAYYEIDESGNTKELHKYPENDTAIRWHMMFHTGFCHTSVMLRSDVLRKHNLFYSAEAFHAEDFELWSKVLDYGQGTNTSFPLVKHRSHGEQVSNRQSDCQRRTANGIVRARLKKLGFYVTDEDIDTLRNWYIKMPTQLTEDDLEHCFLLLRVFNVFSQDESLKSQDLRVLRFRLFHRILNAFSLNQSALVWKSGLIQAMLRQDSLAVLTHLPARGLSSLKKAFY